MNRFYKNDNPNDCDVNKDNIMQRIFATMQTQVYFGWWNVYTDNSLQELGIHIATISFNRILACFLIKYLSKHME